MAIKYRTKGFVFKKDEAAESDQFFTVFTQDFGRVGLKARAVRKTTSKLRADIDIFYLSEIEFIQGKNNKTLTDASKINKFENIISDPEKIKIAYLIANVLDDFLKGQEKDSGIFDLINEVFDNLTNSKLKSKNFQLAFQYFFWNFISLQGYHMQIQECARCKNKLNPNNVYFSCKDGGAICKDCAKPGASQKINSDVVKILRLILKKNWQTISRLKVEPASQKILENISKTAAQSFCPS